MVEIGADVCSKPWVDHRLPPLAVECAVVLGIRDPRVVVPEVRVRLPAGWRVVQAIQAPLLPRLRTPAKKQEKHIFCLPGSWKTRGPQTRKKKKKEKLILRKLRGPLLEDLHESVAEGRAIRLGAAGEARAVEPGVRRGVVLPEVELLGC